MNNCKSQPANYTIIQLLKEIRETKIICAMLSLEERERFTYEEYNELKHHFLNYYF